MCGRSRQCLAAPELRAAAAAAAGMPKDRTWPDEARYTPRQNMCPGQEAAVLACDDGSPSLALMRWGLVPSVSAGGKADHWRMFNARSETVDTLGVFSRLLRNSRCAIPLDGFYEWQDDEFKHSGVNKKQPYYVHIQAGKPMWVAGLHTECADAALGRPLRSFTLITKASAPRLAWLHDRVSNTGPQP